MNNLWLYPENLGVFWPMWKTNTLLCLENIKQIFVYNIPTDSSRASVFENFYSS